MKKFFTLALACVAMSAMAEVQTLLSYTVSETYPQEKVNIPAGGQDSIYVGTASFSVNSTDILGVYGWKMDGDLTEGSTKYVRLHVTEKFAAGDVIYVGGWSGSSASVDNPQGFGLFDGYEAGATTLYAELQDTKTAKKNLFEVSYRIPEESPLIGQRRVYIGRAIGKSVFFHSVRVTRGEEIVADPVINLTEDNYAFVAGDSMAAKTQFKAPHITMTLSDDIWKTVKADTTEEFSEDGYYAIISGTTNGKDTKLQGAYYTFVASSNGTLNIPAKMGAKKNLYVAKNGTNMSFFINDVAHTSGTPASTTVDIRGYISFDMEKDATYHVWGAGTKLGIYGFEFEAEDPTAIENKVEKTVCTKVIRDGQIIIIKNGVEYNAFGARL